MEGYSGRGFILGEAPGWRWGEGGRVSAIKIDESMKLNKQLFIF
jgi:hypothetical protein